MEQDEVFDLPCLLPVFAITMIPLCTAVLFLEPGPTRTISFGAVITYIVFIAYYLGFISSVLSLLLAIPDYLLGLFILPMIFTYLSLKEIQKHSESNDHEFLRSLKQLRIRWWRLVYISFAGRLWSQSRLTNQHLIRIAKRFGGVEKCDNVLTGAEIHKFILEKTSESEGELIPFNRSTIILKATNTNYWIGRLQEDLYFYTYAHEER